jgi:hypothetical protein
LFDKPEIEERNAIKDELSSFYDAVKNDVNPIVPIEDGVRALDIAVQILDKMKVSLSLT